MKEIIIKTASQRAHKETYKALMVSETSNWFWVCESCKKAFFGTDIIFRSSGGNYHCPASKGFWKLKRTCLKQIAGGDEQCFNRYYELSPSTSASGEGEEQLIL